MKVQSALNEGEGARWAPAAGGRGSLDESVDRYMNEGIVWGTPEMVIDQIERLREEINLDYLLLAPLSHQSILTFTEKVLPHFQ